MFFACVLKLYFVSLPGPFTALHILNTFKAQMLCMNFIFSTQANCQARLQSDICGILLQCVR
jgi:hypothetical protein